MQYLGTPCLAFLLCAALIEAQAQARAFEPLQANSTGAQLNPVLAHEYQKLWSQVLKNARVEIGPKLMNPAISRDGLAPGIVRALQEQRTYLETHGAAALTQVAVNVAVRELVGDNLRKPQSFSRYTTCREPMIRSINGKTKSVVFTPMAANNTYLIEGCLFGDAPGIVELEEALSGSHRPNVIPPVPMRLGSNSIDAWSDHEITAQLNTELRGIPDYPVTLVIYSARHRRIELRGCRHPFFLEQPDQFYSLYWSQ